MRKIIYLFLILSVLYIPSIIKAEIELGVLDSDISVDVYPENPEPYQDVTIKLSSYATDLNKAMIEWRSGGKIILSGYGKTNYSFKTLGVNTSTSFQIIIIPYQSIERITKSFVITPTEIEILWESIDGYTPPFYKGKSLITEESIIKVVAIPNTNTIKTGKGDMSYLWKRDQKASNGISGYNKDYFIFKNNVLNDKEKISVSVSSLDGKYNANKETEIPIYSPIVVFYKKSPTEGILYNNALNNNYNLNEGELSIVAEPYYLAIKNNEEYFSYNWKINDEIIETPSKKKELTIRPTSDGGYAIISVVFENIDKFFQKVTGSLRLNL